MVNIPNIPEVFKPRFLEVINILIANADSLNMDELWLFGSLAKGTANGGSDIDLLVLTSGNRREASLKVECLGVRDYLDFPEVDVITRTEMEITSDLYWFNKEVQRDKIVIWRR